MARNKILLTASFLIITGTFVVFSIKTVADIRFKINPPFSNTPVVKPPSKNYICPKTAWIDCMPSIVEIDLGDKVDCSKEYISWAEENCPNFEGAAY